MSIFKKKNKADKGKKEDSKKQPPQAQNAPVNKAAPQPYQPKHAASDAVPKPTAVNGKQLSKEAVDYAQGGSTNQPHPANFGHHPSAQAHNGLRSPSSPLPSYRGLAGGGFHEMRRNDSAEVFTTDPDAPPMPTASSHSRGEGQRADMRRNGYLGQQSAGAPGFDGAIMGNPKMAAAARDRGYVHPHYSADSGYGSEGHSRAPSELANPHESYKPTLPGEGGSFLPELSLSEELMKEPAWSEASFGGDEPVITPRGLDSAEQRSTKSYFSQLDPSNEVRPSQSKRVPRATHKQTRFDPSALPAPSSDRQGQEHAKFSSKNSSQFENSPQPTHDPRPESTSISKTRAEYAQSLRSSTPPVVTYEEPRPPYSAPVRHSSPPPHRLQEVNSHYTSPARLSTPLSMREAEMPQSTIRESSPTSYQQQTMHNFASLERITSRGSMAPLASLEGYKVNKRGKILDEEGEIIGELIEGDIIDCVRQRCTAFGEVLDDHGRVVGRVQPIGHTMESPMMRMASPAPVQPQAPTYIHDRQPSSQPTPLTLGQRQHRRSSVSSQPPHPDVFTPAWQKQSHKPHSELARELRDHLNTAPPGPSRAVAPLDLPSDVFPVEMDGGRSSEEEEVLPIFDHSDVFMPVPFVPPRSPKRSETPSPSGRKGKRVHHQPQYSTQRNLHPSDQAIPDDEISEDRHARHASPPPVGEHTRQLAEPAQPSQTAWAAASLIERDDTAPAQEPKVAAAPQTGADQTPLLSSVRIQRLASTDSSDTIRPQTPQPAPARFQHLDSPADQGSVPHERVTNARFTEPHQYDAVQRNFVHAPEMQNHAPMSSRAVEPIAKRYEEYSPMASTRTDPPREVATTAAPLMLPSIDVSHANEGQAQPMQPQARAPEPQQMQPQARRGILRTTSDHDQMRSYLRPNMSPVLEDRGSMDVAARNPALFAYKGEIPTTDGPAPGAHLAPSRANGVKSPPLPSFPRQAFTGGLPSASPFAPMNSAQFSSAGGLGPRGVAPRQFTTGVPGPRPIPQFQSKNSYNQPLKRSPLSSQETTPPESDQGSNDGEKNVIGLASGMHSRQPSLRSMRSMQSTATTKSRTYFTHGGRVTVGAGEPTPSQQQKLSPKSETEAAPAASEKNGGKKKNRFSLGFGKKS